VQRLGRHYRSEVGESLCSPACGGVVERSETEGKVADAPLRFASLSAFPASGGG
jgi:hypothetical protein